MISNVSVEKSMYGERVGNQRNDDFLSSNGGRDLNSGHRPLVAGFDTNLVRTYSDSSPASNRL